jgi:predicted MPP superfamily phosphohydrolase
VHLFYRYARGLYEEDGKKLYVNPGVGMVGAPVRTVPTRNNPADTLAKGLITL